MRAMMEDAGLHETLNTIICIECVATATKIENIIVNPYEEKCVHEKFYGKIPY